MPALCVPLLAAERGARGREDEGRTKQGGFPRAVSLVTLSVYKRVFFGRSLYRSLYTFWLPEFAFFWL